MSPTKMDTLHSGGLFEMATLALSRGGLPLEER